MGRTARTLAAAMAVLALLTACTKKETTTASGDASTTTTSAGSGTTATSKVAAPETTRTTVDTSDDDELAKQALVGTSDLPPGEWVKDPGTTRGTSSSKSGRIELLDTPSCRELVTDEEAAKADTTGEANEEFTQGAKKEVILTNGVSLYTSAAAIDELGRITASSDFTTCYADALQAQHKSSPTRNSRLTDLEVTTFDVGIDKDDLGVDFVTAVGVRFRLEYTSAAGVEAVGRIVIIGAGRAVSTLQVLAQQSARSSPAVDIDSLDIEPTVRAAAQNLVSITEGG